VQEKQKTRRRQKMKTEQVEKQVVPYAEGLTLQELLSLAIAGDKNAAAEIIRRHESLKIKAASKRAPKAEKTPLDLARDNAYFRTALLVKQFGLESVNLQVLTAASAYLECGLAQGNLRQAFNRVNQVLRAQKVEDQVFPQWIVEAAKEIPVLDENKKLEEESDKVAEIKATIQKYLDEKLPAPAAEIVIPETPEAAETATPAKKAGGKK
jgi:hypothetical protein